MPQLPRGLKKRKVKTKTGTTVLYMSRRQMNGREVTKSLGTDYGLALARFREMGLAPAPVTVAPASPTLEEFTKRWLAEYAASRRTKRGRDQSEQRLRDYVLPLLGAMPLAEIKPADLRRLAAEMMTARVGLVTRRRSLEDVRCMLRYAAEEAEVIGKSPWRRGILPVLPEAEPKPLSDDELAEVVGLSRRNGNQSSCFLCIPGFGGASCDPFAGPTFATCRTHISRLARVTTGPRRADESGKCRSSRRLAGCWQASRATAGSSSQAAGRNGSGSARVSFGASWPRARR
jgi:hypothetical protein